MDHVAGLLIRASALRRRIFASLPWGYRLATVFLSMDTASLEAWGRTVGAMLLKAGVTEMPDPGPKWNPEKPNVRDLPRGYLLDFARKAYAIALKNLGNPASAGDAMQDALLGYLSGKAVIKSVPLRSALSFILTGVTHAVSGIRRKTKREHSLSVEDEGEETTLDLVDDAFEANPYWNENPNAFKKIEDVFPENVWEHEVLPAVTKIHPDMQLYFELLAEGKPGKHIVLEGLLPNFKVTDYKNERSAVSSWDRLVQMSRKVIHEIARQHSN